MLSNYTPASFQVIEEYELVFDDGHLNGFGFPCDSTGALLEPVLQNTQAVENYHRCLQTPERFVRFNKVIKFTRRYKTNAHGTCSCGNEVELHDALYGACSCDKCGRWYNLFGQELQPPENWELD